MTINRISPKAKRQFKNAIRNVVKGLSRKIKVNKPSIKSECPNCYFDKFTNSSTGKCKWTLYEADQKQLEYELDNITATDVKYKWFNKGRCPVCKGVGYLETKRARWVDCLVIWNPNVYGNDIVFTPAGTDGSTVVELKTDPKYFNLFRECVSIVIDGVECFLSKPPILRGLGGQDVLIITAFTSKKLPIDSNEITKDYING